MPEESLAAVLAEVATLPRREIIRVLSNLDERQRARVEAMLGEQARSAWPAALAASGSALRGSALDQLSPWLVDRVVGDYAAHGRMTCHAAEALKKAAAAVLSKPEPPSGSAPPPPRSLAGAATAWARQAVKTR